ncbi:MAG: hypothetical protein ACHQ4G_02100 [Opitutales bacterium]
MTSREPANLDHVINYTIVALLGMVAGLLVGYVMGRGMIRDSHPASPPTEQQSVSQKEPES